VCRECLDTAGAMFSAAVGAAPGKVATALAVPVPSAAIHCDAPIPTRRAAVQRLDRRYYSASYKLSVVREAMQRPESCRIKPTCRAHPGIEASQLRLWIKQREQLEAMAAAELRTIPAASVVYPLPWCRSAPGGTLPELSKNTDLAVVTTHQQAARIAREQAQRRAAGACAAAVVLGESRGQEAGLAAPGLRPGLGSPRSDAHTGAIPAPRLGASQAADGAALATAAFTIAAWTVGVEMASTAAGQPAVAVARPVPPMAPILRPDAPQIAAFVAPSAAGHGQVPLPLWAGQGQVQWQRHSHETLGDGQSLSAEEEWDAWRRSSSMARLQPPRPSPPANGRPVARVARPTAVHHAALLRMRDTLSDLSTREEAESPEVEAAKNGEDGSGRDSVVSTPLRE